MVSQLYSIITNLQQLGVYDVLLPFLIVFTISFAILMRVNIFGTKGRNLNVIIALVIAFFFLRSDYLVFSLNRFVPNVSFIMVVVLAFLLVLGVFIGEHTWGGKALTMAFLFSVISVIYALSTDLLPGQFTTWIASFWSAISPATRSLIIFIIVILIIISAVSREEDEPTWWDLLNQVVAGISPVGRAGKPGKPGKKGG